MTADSKAVGGALDDTAWVTVLSEPTEGSRVGYYVTTAGRSGGSGTASDPWDLETALGGGGGAVEPGDTIWVRGGVYRGTFRSTLTGAPGAPVVVRAYPGERAAVEGDGSTTVLTIDGAWTTFWGLELYDSSLGRTGPRPHIIYVRDTHDLRLINLVIHDGGVALYTDRSAANVEIHGCVFYNNGWQEPDRGHGHGIYIKNDAGWKTASENILFNQFGYNIHGYTNSGSGGLRNITFKGNVSFNAGALAQDPSSGAQNLLLGGYEPADGAVVAENMTYYSPGIGSTNVRVGYRSTANGSLELRDNYVAGGALALDIREWESVTARNNTLVAATRMVDLGDGTLSGYSWQDNAYSADASEERWRAGGSTYSFSGWRSATGLGSSDATSTGMGETRRRGGRQRGPVAYPRARRCLRDPQCLRSLGHAGAQRYLRRRHRVPPHAGPAGPHTPWPQSGSEHRPPLRCLRRHPSQRQLKTPRPFTGTMGSALATLGRSDLIEACDSR
jgi:hypothetical protein